jgi:hypothetical protein
MSASTHSSRFNSPSSSSDRPAQHLPSSSTSSSFSFSPPRAAPRRNATLPFPLPDPYANDAEFEVYDPRGLFKSARRASSVTPSASHSRESTSGSVDEYSGYDKPPASGWLGRKIEMSEAMEGRLRDQSVEERAPTLSAGGKDPTDSGSVLTLPVVPVSRTRSHISRYERH